MKKLVLKSTLILSLWPMPGIGHAEEQPQAAAPLFCPTGSSAVERYLEVPLFYQAALSPELKPAAMQLFFVLEAPFDASKETLVTLESPIIPKSHLLDSLLPAPARQKYNVMTIDIRGTGCSRSNFRSAEPAAAFSIRSVANDMEMLRQHLGASKMHFLASTFATPFVEIYAVLYPEQVGRLVLHAPILASQLFDFSTKLEELTARTLILSHGLDHLSSTTTAHTLVEKLHDSFLYFDKDSVHGDFTHKSACWQQLTADFLNGAGNEQLNALIASGTCAH